MDWNSYITSFKCKSLCLKNIISSNYCCWFSDPWPLTIIRQKGSIDIQRVTFWSDLFIFLCSLFPSRFLYWSHHSLKSLSGHIGWPLSGLTVDTLRLLRSFEFCSWFKNLILGSVPLIVIPRTTKGYMYIYIFDYRIFDLIFT